jgi:hypothetical protein
MRIYAAARLLTLRCLQACFRLKQCAVFFCELLLHATGSLIECCEVEARYRFQAAGVFPHYFKLR